LFIYSTLAVFSKEAMVERSVGIPRRANHFFALLPDAAAAASAERKACALRSWLGLSGWPRGIGKYHVTLWGWPAEGEPDAQGISLMRRAAERIRQGPFKLSFDEVATFAQRAEKPALVMTGGDSVIGAARLQVSLGREMRAGGLRGRRASGLTGPCSMIASGRRRSVSAH
jgi:2'-5' RNA ligase